MGKFFVQENCDCLTKLKNSSSPRPLHGSSDNNKVYKTWQELGIIWTQVDNVGFNL